MGGKRELLEDIGRAVDEMDTPHQSFCDLFAGTAIVSYAFSDSFDIVSNDIQRYSSIFANTYFSDFSVLGDPEDVVATVLEECTSVVEEDRKHYHNNLFTYCEDIDFQTMEAIERTQLRLCDKVFDTGFSFFKRYYSGTYWSYEQCLWIDAIRRVAERHSAGCLYYAIMSSLIFAMSYCAQSTGHFAQFRTLTKDNYKSVLIYRLKDLSKLFKKKLGEFLRVLNHPTLHSCRPSSLDYLDCISTLEPGTIIYADPPYSAVHYSRFYHAVETLVLYDCPELEYKGRYRKERYQSPFDQKSKVKKAFEDLFHAIKYQRCHLLLSYSDNALLSETQVNEVASHVFGDQYVVKDYSRDFKHMKMGRSDDYQLNVHELLLSFTRI